eukprot:CAMPEP_0184708868 /NCGR_PEP_ID=MMETSP0313-20130426/38000_1 /TAXON_ID=2792 /ORGANISM="Porphyridium aerugineum, Strain SAG 1380-2" /LENGTH=620 /DNA_ID=CAMNT_0027170475 /DNA_START=109 /DNA_END=1971 /DNA_ORIENTATION=+
MSNPMYPVPGTGGGNGSNPNQASGTNPYAQNAYPNPYLPPNQGPPPPGMYPSMPGGYAYPPQPNSYPSLSSSEGFHSIPSHSQLNISASSASNSNPYPNMGGKTDFSPPNSNGPHSQPSGYFQSSHQPAAYGPPAGGYNMAPTYNSTYPVTGQDPKIVASTSNPKLNTDTNADGRPPSSSSYPNSGSSQPSQGGYAYNPYVPQPIYPYPSQPGDPAAAAYPGYTSAHSAPKTDGSPQYPNPTAVQPQYPGSMGNQPQYPNLGENQNAMPNHAAMPMAGQNTAYPAHGMDQNLYPSVSPYMTIDSQSLLAQYDNAMNSRISYVDPMGSAHPAPPTAAGNSQPLPNVAPMGTGNDYYKAQAAAYPVGAPPKASGSAQAYGGPVHAPAPMPMPVQAPAPAPVPMSAPMQAPAPAPQSAAANSSAAASSGGKQVVSIPQYSTPFISKAPHVQSARVNKRVFVSATIFAQTCTLDSVDGVSGSYNIKKHMLSTSAKYDLARRSSGGQSRDLLRATKVWSAVKNQFDITNLELWNGAPETICELKYKKSGIIEERVSASGILALSSAKVTMEGVSHNLTLKADEKLVAQVYNKGRKKFDIEIYDTTEEECAMALMLLVVGQHVWNN